MLKEIKYKFRFPVKQTGPKEITLEIKRGVGPPVLGEEWCRIQELSEAEYMKAEELVLRSVAIVEDEK